MPFTIQAGGIPTSVVTADFNRDGKMDFAVANGWDDNIWLYLGHGDGTFDIPRIIPLTQGVSPVWMAAVDLRNTGIIDLVVADIDSASVGVFLGKGDGTFSYEHFYDAGGRPAMLAVGDFNGDGKKDLFLDFQDQTQSSFATLLGNGDGGFGVPIYSPEMCCYQQQFGAAAMDVDHDGRDEVAVAIAGTGGGAILKADETGAFHIVQMVAQNGFGPEGLGNAVTGAALGDMDEDGCPDSVSGWYFGYVMVRKGTCNTSGFADFIQSEADMGDSIGQMILADVNHDGHLDVISGGWNFDPTEAVYGDVAGNMISVALGKGDGTFELGRTYRAGQSTFSIAVADFNGDGMLDIIGASQDTDSVTILLSDGSGGYRGPQGVYIGYGWGGGAVNAPLSAPSFADVTGDGIPDMVMIDAERWSTYPYAIAVTRGMGGGRFGDTIFSSTDVVIPNLDLGDYKLGDFNGDGNLDIVIIAHDFNDPGFINFLPGRGDGTFGPSTLVMDPGSRCSRGGRLQR
jgi:FG-GAP-like repeat